MSLDQGKLPGEPLLVISAIVIIKERRHAIQQGVLLKRDIHLTLRVPHSSFDKMNFRFSTLHSISFDTPKFVLPSRLDPKILNQNPIGNPLLPLPNGLVAAPGA